MRTQLNTLECKLINSPSTMSKGNFQCLWRRFAPSNLARKRISFSPCTCRTTSRPSCRICNRLPARICLLKHFSMLLVICMRNASGMQSQRCKNWSIRLWRITFSLVLTLRTLWSRLAHAGCMASLETLISKSQSKSLFLWKLGMSDPNPFWLKPNG